MIEKLPGSTAHARQSAVARTGRSDAPAPPDAPQDTLEVGKDKNALQHAGNAGFALASLTGAAATISRIAARPRLAEEVPGLNLVVGVLEGFNFVHQARKGQKVVALGHAGNAAGCIAAFAEDIGRFAALAPGGMGHLGRLSLALGIAGGAFGVYQGIHEIRLGSEAKRQTGSTRTLHMGVADLTSGAATIGGIALSASKIAPTVGLALLVGASVCDLASIGIDYLGAKQEGPQAATPPPPAPR